MRKVAGVVDILSREMDRIAGACVAGVMVLVIANIVLRQAFNRPILGTYELVGYLTALGISLALARCAFQNGHIALDYIAGKFPVKLQAGAGVIINLISLCFWVLASWRLGVYGLSMMASGVVSSTAQLPVYPVVLLIGAGLAGLCLVLLVRLVECWETMYSGFMTKKLSRPGYMEPVRKAAR
ncbi:MAG: TRAP transporter small permease [Peptococcaceae bacterium]|jgi:TRAP-type C4-dicarboxylate transport system permease small subunit|nr:TRAP transporter small permease [Peptococcaceae bacterium]